MSLNYYLKIKNQYNLLIFSIDQIIDHYEEIINISYEERMQFEHKQEITNIISQFINSKNIYKRHKEHIETEKRIIDNIIFELCKHEYIEDTIDIDPDRSKVVCYCKTCGLTK